MSFAVVQFGEGKSTIFNTNCRNISLLTSLKQTCKQVCGTDDQLDLAGEAGECKFLFRSLEGYASDVIAPRERLVLLRVEQASKGENLANSVKFVPLLSGALDNKDFMNMLNPINQKGGNKGYGKTGGKGTVYLNNTVISSSTKPQHSGGKGLLTVTNSSNANNRSTSPSPRRN